MIKSGIVNTNQQPQLAMDFDEWIKIGRDNKWISDPVCNTHEGPPTTEDEDKQWIDGEDPCVHVLRLYETPQDCDSAERASNE